MAEAIDRLQAGGIGLDTLRVRAFPFPDAVRDFIDAHCRRGGKAVVMEKSERGDMIVVRHGSREMQLAWTHLLPATFGGRALMNVQNSLAAAAAATWTTGPGVTVAAAATVAAGGLIALRLVNAGRAVFVTSGAASKANAVAMARGIGKCVAFMGRRSP